jgi:hypothetical protein
MDAEFSRRRQKVYMANVRRTERLGRLITVFDGYELAVHQSEAAVPALVNWTDFDDVAHALETRGRASLRHQNGRCVPQEDGSFFFQVHDWDSPVPGEVTVPAEQVLTLARLLRSLPFPPFHYFHTTEDGRRRDFKLVVVHRGELDRNGDEWPDQTPLVELFEGPRFLATIGVTDLLDRADDEPLRVSTTTGPLVVPAEDLARPLPHIRRAVRRP